MLRVYKNHCSSGASIHFQGAALRHCHKRENYISNAERERGRGGGQKEKKSRRSTAAATCKTAKTLTGNLLLCQLVGLKDG